MRASRAAAVCAAALLLAGCGGDAGEPVPAFADGDVVAPVAAPTEVVEQVLPSVPVPTFESSEAAAHRRPENAAVARLQQLEQPAIWPAADVVFATPEESAADFVRQVLIVDGDPELGEFQQGDGRSGEIAVYSPSETGGSERFARGVLFLRQLGSNDGWFVIAAGSDGATIRSPQALAEVAAASLVVEGDGRGFEGTVVVKAFPAGDVGIVFDQEIAMGGAFDQVEPYRATLDLSDATPGEVVTILVQGDTGLGSDPGAFAAIPVVIEEIVPPTR